MVPSFPNNNMAHLKFNPDSAVNAPAENGAAEKRKVNENDDVQGHRPLGGLPDFELLLLGASQPWSRTRY
jgi:hypothetical protein